MIYCSFDELVEAVINRDSCSKSKIFEAIKHLLKLPVINEDIEHILTHHFIILEFLVSCSNKKLLYDRDKNLSKAIDLLRKETDKDKKFIRVRLFDSENGKYIGIPVICKDGAYTFWDNKPVLLTKITNRNIDEQKNETELGWITRPELKIISSLLFSVKSWHGPSFYFLPQELAFDLPFSLVFKNKPYQLHEKSIETLRNIYEIVSRIHRINFFGFDSDYKKIAPFYFETNTIEMNTINTFYENYDLENKLLIRTSFLFIKSAMLWSSNRLFAEDAVANLYIALEGSLKLLHNRLFPGTSFTFEPLKHKIMEIFHNRGYEWYIEQSYKNRCNLVHLDQTEGESWSPSLYADDFYEVYGVGQDLMYYAVTGEILPLD